MEKRNQKSGVSKRSRFFYDIKKIKSFDGKNGKYAAIGCDYTLDLFHKQAQCVCGNPEHCTCKIYVPRPDIDLKNSNNDNPKNTKPMLLFTIRHRRNPSLIYNYFSKDLSEVLEEINRLNGKNRRNSENGFYLDETDFDEKWNRAVISEYRAHSELYND